MSIDFKNELASPTTLGIALPAPASSLSFSADGKRLAVSSRNGELQIWSLDNNQMINRIITGPNPVIGLRWSQDNQQITAATGGSNPALNIYASQAVQRSLNVGLTPGTVPKSPAMPSLQSYPVGWLELL